MGESQKGTPVPELFGCLISFKWESIDRFSSYVIVNACRKMKENEGDLYCRKPKRQEKMEFRITRKTFVKKDKDNI